MLPTPSLRLTLAFLGTIFGWFFGHIVTRVAFHYNLVGCHRAFNIAKLVPGFKGERNIYHASLELSSDLALEFSLFHFFSVVLRAASMKITCRKHLRYKPCGKRD